MLDGRTFAYLRHSTRALSSSQFLRNMTVLMVGTAFSQALLLLAAPLLSRLYDPTAFGVFSLYSAVLAVLAPLVHMRYGEAVVLPKEDSNAGALFVLSNGIVLAISAVCLIAVAVGGGLITRMLNAPSAAGWLWWIPGSLLLVGICEVLEYWATRRRQFWSISSRRITRSVAQVTVQLGAGTANLGSTGLVAGGVVGTIAETLMLGAQVLRRDSRIILGSLQLTRIRAVAAEYKAFPHYGAPQNLLNAVSQSIPTFILSALFGTSVVGLYGMAVRALQFPAGFITGSLRQVFFQRAAEAQAHGADSYRLYRNTTLALTGLVLIPTFAVFVTAPWLFSVILGSRWHDAGVFGRWLVLWLACGVVNVPSVCTLQVLKMQKYLLFFEMALLVSRIVALLVPGLLSGAGTAIMAYSIVGVIANFILILGTNRVLRRRAKLRRYTVVAVPRSDRSDST